MHALWVAVALAAPLEQLVAKVDSSVVTVRVGTRQSFSSETRAYVEVDVHTGSGVLLHSDGYVATAAHVVEDAELVEVHYVDGTKTTGKIVTLSRSEDLALLKVDKVPAKVTVAKLGDSAALKVGQALFSIGAPFGLEHTLTTGVVSALRTKPAPGLHPRKLIQTDVALNRGNSGGPLFNEAGEVVGIASFIASTTGGSMGLNFAVPSEVVRLRLFEQPLPYVGVSLRFITPELAALMNWPVDAAFLVEKVQAESAADAAGLRGGTANVSIDGIDLKLGGDLIISVNGIAAGKSDEIAAALRSLKAGDVIRYSVLRAGKPLPIDVSVREAVTAPRLNLKADKGLPTAR